MSKSATKTTTGGLRAVAKQAPDYTSRAYWNGTIKMSLSKFFILSVLHQQPMHGYDIATAVERTTKGCCSPTEGTIYPALREFEEGGYVTSRSEVVQGRERKVYTLTERGREAFKVAVESWMEITQCLTDSPNVVARAARKSARGKNTAGNCC